MSRFTISTDSCSVEIEAPSADAAVAEFTRDEGIRGVRTLADLEAYLERVGGYGFVAAESGERVMEVHS